MTHPNSPTTLAAPPISPPPLVVQRQFRSLDDTIEQCIGEFGWKQFIQSTIISFAWFFDGQQTFIAIFTDAEPKWRCNNSISYKDHLFSCNATSNICQLPKNSWSWDLPAHTSTISEWSLQCASPIIRGLPASSFLFGCLVGGLVLATLADSKMGRKNLVVLSCLIMAISGALTTVSTNIWIYSGFKFISGFGRSTTGTCAFVLASLESPRWLFIKGKKEEFVKTLRSLTSSPRQQNISTESLFVNGQLNRKGSVVGLSLLSGICSVTSVLVKLKGIQIGLELLSFLSTCMAFEVFMIGTSELFPTCVRNSAVSLVRVVALFGGFLGPILAAVGRTNGLLSYGVFGAAISLCGLLVVWLPETKGRKLHDTMEEEEHKDGEVNNNIYNP
ncbi:hypothetical protein DH2020_033159 [Rehmannia glutinosa]|uniref:Uncharacterized protein n=1 Tax=Rehmannia glutinosa TaxID=99300 RepID=A0ABR0VH32_REHGL